MQYFSGNKIRVGVLGGGQLGKMLGQAAADWHLSIAAMEKVADSPANGYVTQFTIGDIQSYDDVLSFGRECDVITVEIENVNIPALKQLVKEGKAVNPSPEALEIIIDKGTQKMFYKERNLPTSRFFLADTKAELLANLEKENFEFPFVVKLRKGGYDGRGVFIIKSVEELNQLPDVPFLIEEKVKIDKEIAVIASKNDKGEVVCFPPVEMFFDHENNLLEYQISPAQLEVKTIQSAIDLAVKTITAYNINGLLAIEMFIDSEGMLLINEVAPRPHNSGHHTIDANITSQFQQHLRGILNFSLGDTSTISNSIMINLLGKENYYGPVRYHGIEKILALKGANIYLYGKKETKPARKMGHITLIGDDIDKLIENKNFIKENLQIIA